MASSTSILVSTLAEHYTVSFSAYADVGGGHASSQFLYLYKNGSLIDETYWNLYSSSSLSSSHMIGVSASRSVVSNRFDLLKIFARNLPDVKSQFLQILHMDTLDLRMTKGDWIYAITFNIELIGIGFDFHV